MQRVKFVVLDTEISKMEQTPVCYTNTFQNLKNKFDFRHQENDQLANLFDIIRLCFDKIKLQFLRSL